MKNNGVSFLAAAAAVFLFSTQVGASGSLPPDQDVVSAVAGASANAGAAANSSSTSINANLNHNANHNAMQQGQHQGQGQGQLQGQGQNQTATGGNASSTGGSVAVGDTTLTTGPSTSSAMGGAGGSVMDSGNSTNTNTNANTAMGGAGGSVNVADGAVQNSNTGTNTLNVAEGAVTAQGGQGGAGGIGGAVIVSEGAVDNQSNSDATATVGDSNVTVNNNFGGGEDGNGALATQTVEGSSQVVEGSTTNVQVDASTDFRGAPVASVAPVFSTACSGGMSFQVRELGVSVGDAEHYCKLLQLADARFAQAHTIVLIPPTPPVLADCTGNTPDYTKGSRTDNELAKEATASCFRQNDAAMQDYHEVVMAYNKASQDRTMLLNQAYQLVADAEGYVRGQKVTSNIAEQSRKLMYPMLLVKAFALLFL